jgi:cytochrome b subunit of formate dehydrogenase
MPPPADHAAPSPPFIGGTTGLYVLAIVVLSILGVSAVVIVLIVRPPPIDNTPIITVILGFLIPTVTALLAGAVQQVHIAVNSRLTQLLEITATASHAQGQIDGATQQATGPQGAPGVPGVMGPRGPMGP